MVRVGLVFGAGGLSGEAFHRGVLRALLGASYDARDADVLVGTSAGSIMCASLRARDAPPVPRSAAPLPVEEPVLPRLALAGAVRALAHPRTLRQAAVAALPAGRHSTDMIEDGVRYRFGGSWPLRPTWIVGVRRRDGVRVVFGRRGAPPASLAQAVAASCAIPSWFRPVVIGGEAYVDGGVHTPTNADLLADQQLDMVVVSSPMSADRSTWQRPRWDFAARLWCARRLRYEVALLRRAGTPVFYVEPDDAVLRCFSFNAMRADRIDEVEEAALHHAQSLLAARPGVRALLKSSSSAARGVPPPRAAAAR